MDRWGRFVMFQRCLSALVITFRRNSPVYFVRGGESATVKGLNLRGGKDVTNTLLPYFGQATTQPATPQPGTWPPPPDFSIPT